MTTPDKFDKSDIELSRAVRRIVMDAYYAPSAAEQGGLTQEILADVLRTSRQSIQRWIAYEGEFHLPAYKIFYLFSDERTRGIGIAILDYLEDAAARTAKDIDAEVIAAGSPEHVGEHFLNLSSDLGKIVDEYREHPEAVNALHKLAHQTEKDLDKVRADFRAGHITLVRRAK